MASIISNTQLAVAVVVAMLLYEPEDGVELDWVRVLLAPSDDEPILRIVGNAYNYLGRKQPTSTDGYFVYTTQELKQLAVDVLEEMMTHKDPNKDKLKLVRFLINPDDESKIPEAISQALETIRSSYKDNLEGNN